MDSECFIDFDDNDKDNNKNIVISKKIKNEYKLMKIKKINLDITEHINYFLKNYKKIRIKCEVRITRSYSWGLLVDLIESNNDKLKGILYKNYYNINLLNNKIYEIYGSLRNGKYGIEIVIHNVKSKDENSNSNKLKNECIKRNYFNNKKIINLKLINKIAILSRKGSQGYNDFINQMKIPLDIELIDISLEGENTSKDIINAINKINNVDLIIIIRGGGNTTDISLSFDKLDLFEAIKSSKIPIVTAIGHSNDTKDKLLITQISDMDCCTPTTIANKINIECKNMLSELYNIYIEKYKNILYTKINYFDNFVEYYIQSKVEKLNHKLGKTKKLIIREILNGEIVNIKNGDKYIFVRENNKYIKYEIKRIKETNISNKLLDNINNINFETNINFMKNNDNIRDTFHYDIKIIIDNIKKLKNKKEKYHKLKPLLKKNIYLQKTKKLNITNVFYYKQLFLYYQELLNNFIKNSDIYDIFDKIKLNNNNYCKIKNYIDINETTDIIEILTIFKNFLNNI